MNAREIIAHLRHQCASSDFHDHDGCTCADAQLLDRYGYRLVGPGRLDRETIERCAVEAQLQALKSDQIERRTKNIGLRRPAYAHEFGNEIAAALRSLQGGEDA